MVFKVALIVPEGFSKTPEKYGGAIIRAWNVYRHFQTLISNITLLTYEFNTSSALYFFSFFKNLVKVVRDAPSVIVSPWESVISMPQAILLGLFTKKPVIIIVNTIPIFGEVGSGLSSDIGRRNKVIVLPKCYTETHLISRFLCYIKSILGYITFANIIYISRIFNQLIQYIAITPHLANELRKFKLEVIDIYPGNGFPARSINVKKKYTGCYVANPIHPEKGFIDALKIWRKVVIKYQNAVLVIAGRIYDFFPQDVVKQLVKNYGLEGNTIILVSTKGLPHDEIIKLLAQCKVLIYPTRKDIWPLTIAEALSVGTPVVTYRISNIEYAYGWCPAVRLVEPSNIVDAVNEILKLLEQDETINMLDAKKCAQKLSWRRVALLEAKAILTAMKKYYKLS